mgnify:FL=1
MATAMKKDKLVLSNDILGNEDSVPSDEQQACDHEFIVLTTLELEVKRYGEIGAYNRVIGCIHCFIVYYNKSTDTPEEYACMTSHLISTAGEYEPRTRHYFTRMRLFARMADPHLKDNSDDG